MSTQPQLSASDEAPSIECDLPLGRPGLAIYNRLLLSGWAASPKGIAGIAVQIGERQWNASYGLDTPGLADRLRDFPAADRAGYRLELDTSGWSAGPYYVTVAAFDREGGRSAIEGQVEVSPFESAAPRAAAAQVEVELTVERPVVTDGLAEVEGALEISGWAHAAEGIEAVVVTLDGALQYDALLPVVRPDLLADHGREVASGGGFALRIDPVDCLPGPHALSVVAISCDGRRAGMAFDLSSVLRREMTADDVEWAGDLAPPAPREPAELTGAAAIWESRALLAEADAALARAEANLARTAQEATLRSLRDLEASSGVVRRPPATS